MELRHGSRPLDLLGAELDAWRIENPCPVGDTDFVDTDADEAAATCGCSTAGAGGWLVALLALGWMRRRR